jgi:hypothetical protein
LFVLSIPASACKIRRFPEKSEEPGMPLVAISDSFGKMGSEIMVGPIGDGVGSLA